MSEEPDRTAASPDEAWVPDLVRDDVAYRIQRRLGLIPPGGLGIVRRAVFWSLVAWLPIVLWAVYTGRAISRALGEPLLAHFGTHARFLVAVPVLFVAEGVLSAFMRTIVPHLVRAGLVPAADRARYLEMNRRLANLRDSAVPWVVIGGLVLSWIWLARLPVQMHELAWDVPPDAAPTSFGFGGWWFLYVSRSIYLTLLCAWAWRWILLLLWMRGLARLPLRFVPSHPDRAGGAGPLAWLTVPLSLVMFALSSMIASRWAHDALYHGLDVGTLRPHMVLYLAGAVAFCVGPLVFLMPPLGAARRKALLDYGVLAGEQGRLIHRRWIDGERIEDAPVLAAPELGPAADVASLFQGVAQMRVLLVSIPSLIPVVLAVGVPCLVVLAIQVPVKDLLLKIVSALA